MTTERGRYSQLQVGAPVVSMDGEQLGSVKEVRGQYFKVDAPMQPDYWLSLDNVSAGTGGQVMLGFNKDRLGDYQMGSPDETDTSSGRMTDYSATERTTTQHTGADVTDGGRRMADTTHTETQRTTAGYTGTEGRTRSYDNENDEQRTLRLHEERLRAEKQTVEAGEVGIRKEVVSEQQSIDVPVKREEVFIERRAVDDRAADGKEIGDGETIRVPVREEQVNVSKDTVVTGEVGIGKRTVEDTQRVTDTVRREEAHLEKSGDVEIQGSGSDVTRRESTDTTRRA